MDVESRPYARLVAGAIAVGDKQLNCLPAGGGGEVIAERDSRGESCLHVTRVRRQFAFDAGEFEEPLSLQTMTIFCCGIPPGEIGVRN